MSFHTEYQFEWEEAVLSGVPHDADLAILIRQVPLNVTFFDFFEQKRIGQIVVDQDLVNDIQEVFAWIFGHRFPLTSVRPVADFSFWQKGQPEDEVMMQMNNTSGFFYRTIAGTDRLSAHAFGRAIDINPWLNPWIHPNQVQPHGASWNPEVRGTLHQDHPLVELFERLGWEWGGHWGHPDYHHFQKVEAT